jgi:hypothetical protein
MSASFRLATAAIILTALAALLWVSRTIHAQIEAFQTVSNAFAKASIGQAVSPEPIFATPEEPPLRPVPTVHLMEPMTALSSRTWAKLQEPIPFQFPDETPLEDVLKYIKEVTRGPKDSGIPIYVDPVGLQEAEKTMQSTVTLVMEGIPLASSLKLVLGQLGLLYFVDKDGLLVIKCETSDDAPKEPGPLILDNLSELRAEVAALRWEVAALRMGGRVVLSPNGTFGMANPSAMGPMGGGSGMWASGSRMGARTSGGGLQSRPVTPRPW